MHKIAQFAFAAALLLCCRARAQNAATEAAHREFRVRYVTADAVYFNGGTVLGVRPGDKVWVSRGSQKILPLEVKHVSEHSASCLLPDTPPENGMPVRVGDLVLWTIPMPEFLKRTRPAAEAVRNATPAPPPGQAAPAAALPKRFAARRRNPDNDLSGQISFQSFGQKNRGAQQFDFFESSAYLRLHFARPAGLPVRLLTRMRGARNYRDLAAGGIQTSRNRVYEMAVEYHAPGAPLELAAGRMLRHEWRGVGYLDGLALGYRLNPRWKAGLFYGAEPDLYDGGIRLEEKKLGGFVEMRPPLGTAAQLSVALLAVGQYSRRQINREYLATAVDFSFARQWHFTHYLEADLNRGWRRAAGANAVALSNAYLNASYFPSSCASFGVSYDARRLLRTWETRTLVDSLFDQSLRQGWRANVAWQPATVMRFTLEGGWQGQKNSPDVYSAGVTAQAFSFFGLNLSARFSYFGNAVSSGYYPAIDLARSFFGVLYATAGGGAYVYRLANGAKSQNPWERLRLDFNLARRFYLSTTIENFHGGAMQFRRGFADLGWRFQ